MATRSKARAKLAALHTLCQLHEGDPYATLGVPPAADAQAVRTAWLTLVGVSHPDRWAGGTEVERATAHAVTSRLNTARDLLCDPDRRRKYDTVNRVAAMKCIACNGKGTVLVQRGFSKKVRQPCGACDGSGNTP